MVPRLVPEILSLDAFCDAAAAAAGTGIGDSRSWMTFWPKIFGISDISKKKKRKSRPVSAGPAWLIIAEIFNEKNKCRMIFEDI